MPTNRKYLILESTERVLALCNDHILFLNHLSHSGIYFICALYRPFSTHYIQLIRHHRTICLIWNNYIQIERLLLLGDGVIDINSNAVIYPSNNLGDTLILLIHFSCTEYNKPFSYRMDHLNDG